MLEGFYSSAAVSTSAVDSAFWLHIGISFILFMSVVGPMIYFAWKYRADKVKDEEIGTMTHNTLLEITWTVIPVIFLMVFFYYGYSSMKVLRTIPAESESIVIKVEGKKWQWNYEYPANASGFVHKVGGAYAHPTVDENGKMIDKGGLGVAALYVPEDTNIILKMHAPIDDVLHAFYIPALRMKEDVVPGRTTKQWFNAKAGEYDIECAEYCGTDHSYMYSRLVVLPKAKYDAWFNSKEVTPKGDYAKGGDALLQRHGCKQCHAIKVDKVLVGPSLTHRLTAEQVLDVINNGQNKLGYAMGEMPAGLASGTDAKEIAAYVAGGMKGEKPASFAACSSCHGEDGKGQYGTAPAIAGYDATFLSHVLKNGKKGLIGKMPAFPDIPQEDISVMAEYLDKIK